MEGSEEEEACFYQQWKNFPIRSGPSKDNLGSTEQRRFTPLHWFQLDTEDLQAQCFLSS